MKGANMGKLKEKFTTERLAGSRFIYLMSYLLCMGTGWCTFVFGREFLYQFSNMRYYGMGYLVNVISVLLALHI